MKRKILIVLVCCFAIIGILSTTFAVDDLINRTIDIFVNGEKTMMQTLIYDDKLYVPLREVYNEHNYEVTWDGEKSAVYVSKGDLTGFIEKEIPTSQKELEIFSHSYDFYEVYLNHDGNVATRPFTNQSCKIDTEEIIYIIEDMGEWGGKLFYRNNMTTDKEERPIIELLDENVIGVCHLKHDYPISYVMTDEGYKTKIHKISYSYEKKELYISDQIAEIKGMPCAYTVYNDKLILVASTGFYQIEENGIVEALYYDDWESGNFGTYTSPNSILIKNDTAYIGMRAGVATFDLKTNEIKWFQER